eukprot:3084154-Amphidinium_carterae.1
MGTFKGGCLSLLTPCGQGEEHIRGMIEKKEERHPKVCGATPVALQKIDNDLLVRVSSVRQTADGSPVCFVGFIMFMLKDSVEDKASRARRGSSGHSHRHSRERFMCE